MVNRSEYISDAVIRRLPRYYRHLGELMNQGITRISSGELGAQMGLTASQVRQDFNHFGGFGQQGYGYNVKDLYKEVASILGIDQMHKAVIIGAGHLGAALVKYPNFIKRGFDFVALFDVNPDLIGTDIGGVPIYSMDTLEEYIEANNIDIVVLTIPKVEASLVGERLSSTSIRGIWNFASRDLKISNPNIIIENVQLSDSLMRLSYRMHNDQRD